MFFERTATFSHIFSATETAQKVTELLHGSLYWKFDDDVIVEEH